MCAMTCAVVSVVRASRSHDRSCVGHQVVVRHDDERSRLSPATSCGEGYVTNWRCLCGWPTSFLQQKRQATRRSGSSLDSASRQARFPVAVVAGRLRRDDCDVEGGVVVQRRHAISASMRQWGVTRTKLAQREQSEYHDP